VAEKTLYEELARHLDQGIIGSPPSPALIGILEVLFPEREARIAVRLPFADQTLAELTELFPEEKDALEGLLDRMARRGTVFTSQRPGEERIYRLLPSVVGWAETPFWPGKETEETRKLSPLWLAYRNEAFGEELARGGVPPVRVIPLNENLPDTSQVVLYEDLESLVERQSYRAVAHCGCRMMRKSVGEGCDHSQENCLHFGDMGRYMVEHGMAREITAAETMKILRDAHEEGLVHNTDNVDAGGVISTICNCCGCCCVFLDTKKSMGLHTFSTSSYFAHMDEDVCTACGNCEERCPMNAITVDEISVVDEEVCIGCGVCIPTCSSGAAHLIRRPEAVVPPDIPTFLGARIKAAG
jgi:electron transport complex protein RnfB